MREPDRHDRRDQWDDREQSDADLPALADGVPRWSATDKHTVGRWWRQRALRNAGGEPWRHLLFHRIGLGGADGQYCDYRMVAGERLRGAFVHCAAWKSSRLPAQ